MTSVFHQFEDHLLKLPLVFSAESIRRIGRELRSGAQWRVRRIEIDEIALLGRVHHCTEGRMFDARGQFGELRRYQSEVVLVADLRILVLPAGYVEQSTRVQAKEAVVSGAVQVDEHGRQERGVFFGLRTVCIHDRLTQRIEFVPDGIIVVARRSMVVRLELSQSLNDLFPIVAQLQPAADQVGVDVREPDPAGLQRARLGEVKEHGAASEEGLMVGIEVRGVEFPKRRQKLPLAACPLQERPSMSATNGGSRARTIRGFRQGRVAGGAEWRSRTHRNGRDEARF